VVTRTSAPKPDTPYTRIDIHRVEGVLCAVSHNGTQGSTRMGATPSSSARHSATDAAIRTGVILLTLFAAAVHLSLLFPDPVFILNGLGYLTLLAALYLPISRLVPHRRLVRWTLIGYATLTILLWVVMGERTLLGYTTTAGEVVLVGLVVLEGRRLRARSEAGSL
jgi:hypothetical protein